MTRAVEELLRADLMGVYETEAEVDCWLRSPQPLLGGRTPTECVDSGHMDQVLAVVDQLLGGAFV